jgi:predicted transcriptional regulator
MTKASTSESPTLRIPVDKLSDIQAIARATERSTSYIIVRALRTYLLNEGTAIFAAMKERQQIAAGEYEDIKDVIADMDRIIAGENCLTP